MIELPLAAGELPVAFDCRHFLGDRPCTWHKQEGANCVCDHYAPVREHLLLIKLDAMGDVLRTTALLPALAETRPGAAITWITRPEARPLLAHNPHLAEVIAYGPDSAVHLMARRFDHVINLDAGKLSAGLATLAQAPRKDGFLLHEKGHVVPTNAAARSWFEMGVSDGLKRANRRTYQDHMLAILGLSGRRHEYVYCVTPAERRRAREHFEKLGLDRQAPVVGLNTGAGGRWEQKRWRYEGFLELIERAHRDFGAQPLLLGGPGERELNARLREASPVPVFDAGTDNDLRHFAALTEQCDAVVTGDTLALHIALAVGCRVVALFGPTSASEIELYGLGEKVLPRMDCLGCYKSTCDFVPNCMDLIGVDAVAAALGRQLGAAQKSEAPERRQVERSWA